MIRIVLLVFQFLRNWHENGQRPDLILLVKEGGDELLRSADILR